MLRQQCDSPYFTFLNPWRPSGPSGARMMFVFRIRPLSTRKAGMIVGRLPSGRAVDFRPEILLLIARIDCSRRTYLSYARGVLQIAIQLTIASQRI